MPESHVLEIEERLARDAQGAERDAILAELAGLGAAARRSLDRGVPPAEAGRWRALIAAIEAAGLAVRAVWLHLHR